MVNRAAAVATVNLRAVLKKLKVRSHPWRMVVEDDEAVVVTDKEMVAARETMYRRQGFRGG